MLTPHAMVANYYLSDNFEPFHLFLLPWSCKPTGKLHPLLYELSEHHPSSGTAGRTVRAAIRFSCQYCPILSCAYTYQYTSKQINQLS